MYIYIFLIELVILLFLSKRLIYSTMRFLYKVFRKDSKVEKIFALIFLPGTFIHETAHFLSALFLLVPVGNIELMPRKDGDNLKLGSVPIGKTDPFRRLIVGLAPLLFGLAIIFFIIYWITSRNLFPENLLFSLFAVYLIFQVSNTMFLSKKDTEGFWIVGVIFLVLFAGYKLLGVNITVDFSAERQELINNLFKNASLFLLVPIVIDIIFIFLMNLIKR